MDGLIDSRYNVVTNADLRSHGVSGAEIVIAVACCLRRLGRGVYSIVRACERPQHERIRALITDTSWTDYFGATTEEERASDPRFAAHLARLEVVHYPRYRPDDVVVGVSAALLHELPLFDLPLRPLTIAHPRVHSESPWAVRRRRPVPDADRAAVAGVAVTSTVRTGLDLIEVGGVVAGFAALEGVLRTAAADGQDPARLGFANQRKLHDRGRAIVESDFVPVAERLTRGGRRAMRVLELLSPLSENYAESRCSLNLHLLGLHDFDQQWNVASDGTLLTRLDFLHRATMTAIAVDGTGKYLEYGRDRLKRESFQHNRLLSMGYTVVHFSFSEVLNPQAFGLKLFEQAPALLAHRGTPSRF
ncbi:hypothetical protein [Brevibacterium sp. NPDC059310]|uniref:hypothetical protein n=1 Tax=Brevibacterium sp. NPDC059310 TaxID=3346802 RepID=UPI0036708079